MNLLLNILKEIWLVTTAMAPYLLFGFLMAGILSVVISRDFVRRHLGIRGWSGALKAALVGVPMPICSCGVIPLAASLRKHGASRGATASFLASTPQTGIDSLMITYALLGWVFAVFRAIAAFVSGIICGVAVEAVSEPDDAMPKNNVEKTGNSPHENLFKQVFSYAFVTLPRDIARPLIIGIVVSGILSGLIPEGYFAENIGDSPLAMLLMLAIGIPLYVCSSASVPIALAFMKAGLSPGAALVFLITGPATNAATLTTLWNIIGKKQLIVFLITLALCALGAGLLINQLNPATEIYEQICHMHETTSNMDLAWALLLLILLAKAMLPQSKKTASSA